MVCITNVWGVCVCVCVCMCKARSAQFFKTNVKDQASFDYRGRILEDRYSHYSTLYHKLPLVPSTMYMAHSQ